MQNSTPATAPITPPSKNSEIWVMFLCCIVTNTKDTAKTIGIPPIAPAIRGPAYRSSSRINAVITAAARLLRRISMYFTLQSRKKSG